MRPQTPTAPQIIDEASDWFVLMREPSISAENRAAFAQWLRASPVHVGAYLEVAKLWGDAAHIDRALSADLGDRGTPNVVQLREGADSVESRESTSIGNPVERPSRAERGTGNRDSRFRLALAAALMLALTATFAGWYLNRAPTYITDIGEQRILTLEDGSIVRMNSRSKVAVRMKSDLREIELLDGQALFEVAHDEARPFIVRSGGIGVRAVGTQFDVNQRHSGTVVTVVEGRVQVGTALHESQPVTPEREPQLSQDRPTRQDQLFISAGEQIRVAQNGAIVRTQTVDTAAAISWLRQELRFDGQPLSDVLEEFNRYTRTPLVLTDASLADFRINAVFHTTNPDALLKFVARIDNVQIERTGKEIRISRRE